MPTTSEHDRVTIDHVPDLVAAATFPRRDGDDLPDLVGLEAEVVPIQVDAQGSRRLELVQVARIARAWAQAERGVRPTNDHPALLGFALPGGERITFEPGGQLEVSGVCLAGASDATAAINDVLAGLARAFAAESTVLVSTGVDLWHDVDNVPQQLRSPRYPAMAAYFARRGPHGATMMRHTASVQVNLDPGTGQLRDQRWAVANLAAPLATASFANSPDPAGRHVSLRAHAWRHLDPTRTGFAPRTVADNGPPPSQLVGAALDADVLLVRHGDDAVAGTPGWRFRDWLEHGHPEHGYPTAEDLAYHLTTLFHEVRPRGALEIRSIDALPARWRVVPVVLYVGLLYDDTAREQVLRVLEPHRGRLPELLVRAGEVGVADASLCALAVETWSYAIEGARRLGAGVVSEADVRRAEAFVDRFTMRGRCPADELRELFIEDRAAARSWATEPVPTVALC